MATLTIEIPQEILRRNGSRRLLVVDPKKFAEDLRRSWELGDAVEASKLGRREHRTGKARVLKSLSELMK